MIVDRLNWCIAGLEVLLDAQDAGLNLAAPCAHTRFLINNPGSNGGLSSDNQLLTLQVRDHPTAPLGKKAITRNEIWELWRDQAGRFVFNEPRTSSPQQIVINPDFSQGEIFGKFYPQAEGIKYPYFYTIEIVIFVNWLANMGDVVLHAAGLDIDGRGVAFLGHAGAGKSTLAAALVDDPAVTVLGEDQVILRCLEGRYWIYGTPWHVNPEMCAPHGVPLSKIFFLNRFAEQGVKEVDPLAGTTHILQTAFIPYYRPDLLPGLLNRLSHLVSHIPLYTLSYQLGADIIRLIEST